ncbi:hypothetical protein [Nocardiopsis ansamitocini]|uniref:HTH-type transcriptional repressor KstR2 C-terminal domain-containing protein n=1 Tax=Nocardiopsis ansamitocini TaxID=1670832 RepID=A0A9W6P8D8_9ACTN|nr:hypothetical protein [Nocardiopsis ansamitocini]GLU48892.1 hypothetical protein Nans01_32430 [Nocardiopsis ansamitocini]
MCTAVAVSGRLGPRLFEPQKGSAVAVVVSRFDSIVAGTGVEGRLRAAAVEVVVAAVAGPVAVFPGRSERELFHGLIEQGQRSGVFADQVAGDVVADFFFGSVRSLRTWFQPRGEWTPAAAGEYYARLLLDGLRPAASSIAR